MAASTERALADSLMKLLARKTLDKITVRDITDDCGVNRQTVYYHFQDVYDLVDWIFVEASKGYMRDGLTLQNWRVVVRKIRQDLAGNKSFIMNTYYSLNRRQLDQFMYKLVQPSILALIAQMPQSAALSEEDRAFVADMFTFALCGIVTEWIARGMPPDDSRRVERSFSLMEGSMEHVLEKLTKEKESNADGYRRK